MKEFRHKQVMVETEYSHFSKRQSRYVERNLLNFRVLILLILMLALAVAVFETDRYVSISDSLFISLFHNGLLLVGYGVILLDGMTFFVNNTILQKYFRYIAMINLGSGLFLSLCLIIGPVFWLERYLEFGRQFERMFVGMLVALGVILVIKLISATNYHRFQIKMLDWLNYFALGIKLLIIIVVIGSCYYLEEEVALTLPILAFSVGVSLFACDAISVTSYLLRTDRVCEANRYNRYALDKASGIWRFLSLDMTWKSASKKASKRSINISRILKMLIVLNLIALLVGTHKRDLENIDRVLNREFDLSEEKIAKIRFKEHISRIDFLNPVQSLPRALPTTRLLPKASEAFYVMDELNWLSADQEALVLAINQRFSLTKTQPQLVLALVEESDDDFNGYVTATFDAWGIGQTGFDNGILLLFARNQGLNNVRIEVGYGLEDSVTDGFAKKLLDGHQEALKSTAPERVSQALISVFQEIATAIQLSEENEPDNGKVISDRLVQNKVRQTLPSLLTVFKEVWGKLFAFYVGIMFLFMMIVGLFNKDNSNGSRGEWRGSDSSRSKDYDRGSSGTSSSSNHDRGRSDRGSHSGGGGRSGGGGASI